MKQLIHGILLTLCCISLSRAADISFRKLSTETGLSHNSITSLFQDGKGFIWIGTREGLNCYNGNSINQYRAVERDSSRLNGSFIRTITGNGKDKVYILNTNGIVEYDDVLDRFNFLFAGQFQQICYMRGHLYILDRTNIYELNEKDNSRRIVFSLPDPRLVLTFMRMDSSGNMWIGTEKGGLYLRKKDSGLLKKVIDDIHVIDIYQDSGGEIWVGSWEHGLFRINGERIINYRHQAQNPHTISSDFVRCTVEDNKGEIWVGTFRGLNKLDKNTGQFTAYNDTDTNTGLSNASVWSIIKDQQGTIWVGTYFGGVNYFNPAYEIYTFYRKSESAGKGLSSAVVGKMTEDANDNLWVCTEGGGLNQLNKKTGQFTWYKHDPGKNSISQNNLKAICFDKKRNALWIGTHLGGLNKMDLATRKFTHFPVNENDSTAIPSNIIREIIPYGDQIILATSKGIVKFNPETGKSTRLLDVDGFTLLIDKKGVLWVAGIGTGVFAYHFDTKEFRHYPGEPGKPGKLSGALVNRILEDKNGMLWFGTAASGLNLFCPETDDFKHFDLEKNGVASNSIYDLYESSSGNLIIVTNQSFTLFNPKHNSFKDYRYEYGFPLGAMNENGLFVDREGRIFLGGVNGMVSFFEKDLENQDKPYDIILERLIVNNKLMTAGDDPQLLQQSLSNTSAITLSSKYSVFSIEWATNNFIPANSDNIVYKLEGFSDNWIPATKNHPITYTNLSPGLYKLIIKSQKPGGPRKELLIRILPPFYKTVWMYLLYFLLFAAIMYYVFKAYKTKIRLQESLRYEQRHIRDIESMNQAKLRFFTSISHEFRTPLTLIIGQIEQLLLLQGSIPPHVLKKVSGIHHHSIQLRDLITELLDFRKQEEGHLRIKGGRQNLSAFIRQEFKYFESYASARKIDFLLDQQGPDIQAWFDARQMQKVVNNLLSNAFRHTVAGGMVTLSLQQEKDSAIMKVADTGKGIAPEHLPYVFDPFYQVDDTADTLFSTGLGLTLAKSIVELHHGTITVESQIGTGTTFIIRLPFDNAVVYDEPLPEMLTAPLVMERLPLFIPGEDTLPEMGDQTDTSKKRLLIVEDNPDLREMMRNLFNEYYLVESAGDGKEGLEKARSTAPDIIISDVLMPQMTGTELCRKLKSDYITSHIPIILLTARASVEHTLEGLLTGADDYIPKPFNTSLLLARCHNIINNRVLLQEKFGKQPDLGPQVLATNLVDKKFLEEATRIIESNLDNPDFNVAVFSREMGIARTNLFVKLKAVTGKTPNDFIATLRLKKGAYLLQTDPEISVAAIAERIGFSSSQYFSRCFKEIYQLSPLAYRKRFFDIHEKDNQEE
ncbi:signal transduction histidine kinase [Chitinophaga dinghuensis]|uniref:histidine kinase n=1 Tax=Chitinophaga dinghuensis TaxID=1539050 RepID=A0A327VHE1_9BACT|nr:two-component regulator propeller domain-containing protein [Chitinophaga dinghuensis]RAJ72796.1 signal transduction histidine kinase [Chitinophaga dinghuensis]